VLPAVALLCGACSSDPGDGGGGDGPLATVDQRMPSRDASAAVDAAVPVKDLAVALDAGPSSQRQTARPLGSTTAPNGFYEYLPPGYASGANWPLLVFWHGVGEDGNGVSDLPKVLVNGPPMLISKDMWPADRPFVVLSPQHGPTDCPSADEVQKFFTWAMANYTVDAKRIYLTGLSCGAIGSWSYINVNLANQISAAVLISGDPGDPSMMWSAWGNNGCKLGQVAIWAFHGDMDNVVNIGNEQTTMNDLIACPMRRDARFKVIPGGSHFVWGPVYDLTGGDDIYAWLLANPHP
jgi:poly(3-hydroxybutyrate) depolymerase